MIYEHELFEDKAPILNVRNVIKKYYYISFTIDPAKPTYKVNADTPKINLIYLYYHLIFLRNKNSYTT
jgi:hypothetical protein